MTTKSPRSLRTSAPGKLMIAGEYAVLWGHRALVGAVSRRVVVRVSEAPADGWGGPAAGSRETPTLSPEVRVARTRAEARTQSVLWGEPVADVTALLDVSGVKLGLGSSSANAVATAAAVYAAAGRDLSLGDVRDEIFAAALEGHRAVSPHGSGADVAASTYGGVLAFTTTGAKDEETAPQITLADVQLPHGLHTRVVWTGHAVRTSEFVSAVRALAAKEPKQHAGRIAKIAMASNAMIAAMEAKDIQGVLAATHEHTSAMADLGNAAGVPIVEDRLARVAAIAAVAGGAAKPSGAGGGDVAIGFFASAAQADAFTSEAAAEGFTPLALHLGADGVREDHS